MTARLRADLRYDLLANDPEFGGGATVVDTHPHPGADVLQHLSRWSDESRIRSVAQLQWVVRRR